jgi:hypothetical protein
LSYEARKYVLSAYSVHRGPFPEPLRNVSQGGKSYKHVYYSNRKNNVKNGIQKTSPVPAPLKAINIDFPKLGHASLPDIRVGFRKKKL